MACVTGSSNVNELFQLLTTFYTNLLLTPRSSGRGSVTNYGKLRAGWMTLDMFDIIVRTLTKTISPPRR